MDVLTDFFDRYLRLSNLPSIRFADVLEIIILSRLFYRILRWIKNTRAWGLMKGALVLIVFILIANALEMNTIMWLVQNLLSVGLVGLVIIFQPELRRSLEELGRKRMIPLLSSESRKQNDDSFSDKTVTELVKASFEMGKAKTGALIVIEQDTPLGEYERTGIRVDGIVTSQLLLNIFEKNTPLHDGAVIIRGNRVTAATCYLPLSDNMEISKELGTRHRAGLGISEVTDSVTIIVSEETGAVSLVQKGRLMRGLTSEELKAELLKLKKDDETNRGLGYKLLKGLQKNEEKADQ